MKYIKPYNRKEIEQTLKEICLELEDVGYNIDIDTAEDNIGVINIFKTGPLGRHGMNYLKIEFSEIKEYLLRIKDYLGDNYISSMWLITKDGNPYIDEWVKFDLNEDTEREYNKGLWAVLIQYHEIKYIQRYEAFEINYYADDSSSVLDQNHEMEYKEGIIRDICLELEDLGVNIRINVGKNNSYNDGVYRNINMSNFGYSKGGEYFYRIKWPELKEYLLRIKDFLGGDFGGFLINKLGQWRNIELDENTELDTKYLVISISYNKLQLKK